MEQQDGANTHIHEASATWSFTFDLSHLPDYSTLTMRGKACDARTQRLIEAMRAHLAQITNAEGKFVPTIIDLREEGPATFASLKAGQQLAQAFPGMMEFTTFILSPSRRDASMYQNILFLLDKVTPDDQFTTAFSIEEAVEKVRQFHQRHAAL
jgi:hypothetical protein